MLAKVGPNGKPIPIPCICLQNLLLNMKTEFKTDNSKSDLKSFLDRPMRRESWLGKSLLRQISIVSVNGTFVNKFSISNEVMKYMSQRLESP